MVSVKRGVGVTFLYFFKGVVKIRDMEHPGTFRNIPEHPGTSNNYDNYEKKMYKLKFWDCSRDHLKRSEWSRRSRNMFLSQAEHFTSK